jgi:hypothetical protein
MLRVTEYSGGIVNMGSVKFNNLLQGIIRLTGIRLTIIAQSTELLPAMLSQFTNGSRLPGIVQLRSLLNLLHGNGTFNPAVQNGQIGLFGILLPPAGKAKVKWSLPVIELSNDPADAGYAGRGVIR